MPMTRGSRRTAGPVPEHPSATTGSLGAPMMMTASSSPPSPSPIKQSNRSMLLSQIHGQKSIGSIDVFGTGESINYDLRTGSVSFSPDNSRASSRASSPTFGLDASGR